MFFNEKIDLCYPCVLFPSFDFNFIVDLRCGVSVSSERWFFVFLAVPVLVPHKGFVARSFFAFDFVCRATPSRAQDSIFLFHNFDLSSSITNVYPSPVFSLFGRAARDCGPKASCGYRQSACPTRARSSDFQLEFPSCEPSAPVSLLVEHRAHPSGNTLRCHSLKRLSIDLCPPCLAPMVSPAD
jgi:hypothetical protein